MGAGTERCGFPNPTRVAHLQFAHSRVKFEVCKSRTATSQHADFRSTTLQHTCAMKTLSNVMLRLVSL
eukprot:7162620-Pyramimonas_sp.AAC.1